MITKISVLPDCFEASNNTVNLIAVLKDILNNGILIADFSTGNWTKTIQTSFLNDIDQKYKDKVLSIIKQLKNRKKIVKMGNYDYIIRNLDDWVSISKLHCDNEHLKFVLSGNNLSNKCREEINNKCFSVDTIIMEENWDIAKRKDVVTIKTPSSVDKILKPLLSDANTLKLIDPYFNDGNQYKSLLNLCIKSFRNRAGLSQERGIIEIHTTNNKNDNLDLHVFQSRIANMLNKLNNTPNHTIKVYIWKNNSSNDKFHDRFILTNTFGVSVSHSLGVVETSEQQTTWNLLDQETFEIHVNNFSEEDPKFQLECEPLILTSV